MKALQKLLGLILLACGILSAILTGDGTAAIMLIPLGTWMIFSKDNLLSLPSTHRHNKMQTDKHSKRKGA